MLREMEFDLMLHLDPQLTPDTALAAGETWRQGLEAFATGIHEGILPPAQSFLSFEEGSRLIQFSFASQLVRRGDEEEKAYVLRVYDVTGQASDTKVTFPWNIRSAVSVNLKGECGGACSFDGRVREATCRTLSDCQRCSSV